MASARSIGPGQRIGHYVVDAPLGRGAMGVVFRAVDVRLDRPVALKLVNPDFGNEAGARLRTEARALARLSHPNVVPVFDAGIHEGTVYIAMELVDGTDLARWLAAGPHPRREVLRIFLEAARGLEAAHRAGLVHRDFKPSNVLLGTDGRARVVDFGLARVSAPSHSTDEDAESMHRSGHPSGAADLTDDGVVMGTPHYMAPEQHYGEPVGPAADQYAFCVSLWEALYGERPFVGFRAHEIVAAKRFPPEHPPDGSDVPHALFDVVVRGLQPAPEQRYAGMSELAAALQRTQRSRRRLWAPALVAAALGVVVVQLARSERTCDGGLRSSAVWNDDVAESIERSFAATERAYASEAYSRTASVLDDWFVEWTSTFDETCRAAPEDALDRTMSCLADRMREAEALLAVLADADAETMVRAVEAARGLAPADACSDPELWASTRPIPTDPAQRGAVQLVRDELARAHALSDAGRYPEGLAAAAAASASAQAVDFAPVEAEALAQLATLQADNGDRIAAVASYEQAYFVASQSGHDLVAAEAAVGLAWLHSENADLEAAAGWTVHARSSLERAGGDATVEAELEHALGGLASQRGAWDEALDHFARVPDLVGEHDLLSFTAIFNAGIVYVRRDDNASAKRSFSTAIEVGSRELGPESPQVGRAHELLGVALRSEGEIEAAIGEQRLALAILERGLGPEHSEVAGALLNLARSVADTGDGVESLRLYQRALAIAEAHQMTGHVCAALNNMAYVLAEHGYYDAAWVHLQRSLALHEREYGAEHSEVAHPLLGLGGVAAKLGRYQEAIGFYERALALTAGRGNTYLHAEALHRIGDVRAAQGRLEEALRLHRLGLAEHERIDGRAEIDVADALTDVGETLVAMHRFREARAPLQRAVDIYSGALATAPVRAKAQRLLGTVLWTEPSERARGLQLIRDAAAAYRKDGTRSAAELADVEAWLRDHEE